MGFMEQNKPFVSEPWPFKHRPACKLVINLLSPEGTPRPGVEFTVLPKRVPLVVDGNLIDPGPMTKATDSNGYLEFTLSQGLEFYVTSPAMGGVKFPLNTTDQSEINLAEVIAAAS